MGKKKMLAKNIGILTMSQFATKFLSFFLIPLYTSILTTADYGVFDLLNNTVAILVPILTLNISEAVVRFVIDEGTDKESIFCVGAKYIVISNVVVVIGVVLLQFVPVINRYGIYISLTFFVQSMATFLACFARGLNRFKDISIASVLTTAVVIGSNILFLVVLQYGLDGYFIANILGPLFQIVFLCLRIKVWKYIGKKEEDVYEREMISYSKPMIANSIGWWINSASDRYVVTLFCGIAENGIYSVASKIPSIINLMVGIFNQAWTLSSAKEFDDKDQDGFFSELYNLYNGFMVISCAVLIGFNKLLSGFLYSKDFYVAWRYVPFLLIASALGAISGYMGGIFSAAKDSKTIGETTMVGAFSNLAMNVVFVPCWGALGAAVATLISYWITYLVRLKKLRTYIQMKMYIVRDNISYIILTIQGGWWLFNESYAAQVVFTLLQFVLYRKEIVKAMEMVGKRFCGIVKRDI